MTQCEGLVWFYARHLSANGVPVVRDFPRKGGKIRSAPYEWDRTTRQYVNRAANGRPMHKASSKGNPHFLTSARGILEATRFQNVLSIELWDYLLSGFFDERNGLAHGVVPVTEEMAVAAVLCLGELIESINAYEKDRLNPRS